MNSHRKSGLAAASAAVFCCCLATGSYGELTIPRHSIDGGGGTSSAGSLALTGTIGQPDAFEESRSGSLVLIAGFWAGIGLFADFDGDGDIDLLDFDEQYRCLDGPTTDAGPGCVTDLDGDGDVDLKDVARLQDAFTG